MEMQWGFPGGSVVKNRPATAGDMGLIPGSGRSPGGGNGNPLQSSCLENSMDRGAWQATVHVVINRHDWAMKHARTHSWRCSKRWWCSVAQSCLTLCDPMNCSTPGLSGPHCLPEFAQFYVHCISDAVQPSHPLPPSSPALNLSQHQGLFQWVIYLYRMTKILELQLQYQSFYWTFRLDFP